MATKAKTEKRKFLTPIFRVSYPHLFKPNKSEDGKSDVYAVTMIFERGDIDEMVKVVKEVKDERFGPKASGKFKPTFRKGTSEEFDLNKNPEYKGKIIAVARSYDRPVGIVRLDKKWKGAKDDPKRFIQITEPQLFYSGCYAMATISPYAYDHPKGGKGVGLGLQNIIKVRDGEPLAGASAPEADFAEIDVDLFDEDDEDFDVDDLDEDDIPF